MAEETAPGLRRLLESLTAEFGDGPPSGSATFPAPAPAAGAVGATALALRYQPKIDLRRRCLAGAVAAAPAGADAGRALDALFDDWTVFEAAGFNVRVEIALGIDAIASLDLATRAAEWRERAPAWPGVLIEIGEEEIVRDMARMQSLAPALEAAGIGISITNFGAGYSSLATLRELRFAEVKLNPSFADGCASNPTNAAICQTAIELAHRLNALAVAEGIAGMADFNALQVMGCDLGQGTLFAPELPRDEFIALLQRHLNGAPARPAAKSA
jgi:EAL domain-containing protein (putative c-di-GMP-specific phosphodiesterase class I)